MKKILKRLSFFLWFVPFWHIYAYLIDREWFWNAWVKACLHTGAGFFLMIITIGQLYLLIKGLLWAAFVSLRQLKNVTRLLIMLLSVLLASH